MNTPISINVNKKIRDHVEAVFTPNLNEAWELVRSQIMGAYQQKREPTVRLP